MDGSINDRFERLESIERINLAERRSKSNFSSRYSAKSSHPNEHLPWRERLKHTTWAYFTLTMATGGIANVLHSIPYRSQWLEVVGFIYFILNIVLYLIIWAMVLTRFISHPTTFRSSIVHPTESLFVPAAVVSLVIICITIVEYAAHDLTQGLLTLLLVLFWTDVTLAFTLSIGIYMTLWSSLTFTIAQMTPIWIFPAYPLLVIGPHAANLSAKVTNPATALEVIMGGFIAQGIGFLVSLTIYSAFVYRLMTQKLPADPSRPAMFVSVGPAAFTVSGTIGMAANLHRAIAEQPDRVYMDIPAPLAAQVLRLVGNWMCLWLWGLAVWFFFVSVISNVAPLFELTRPRPNEDRERLAGEEGQPPHGGQIHWRKIPFAMTWFSYIFPQTALTTATFRIAEAFDIKPLAILGCVMSALLVVLWFFVVGMMIRAVLLKQILWPEKGEDRKEGGFVPQGPVENVVRRRLNLAPRQDAREGQDAGESGINTEQNGVETRNPRGSI